MKLTENDIGKYFKRRDGEKVYLLSAFPEWHAYDFIACSVDDADDFVPVFSNGTHHPSGVEIDFDIIAPWPETRTIKGWVNIRKPIDHKYYFPIGRIYSSKEDANRDGYEDPIACKYIEITYTEGEGVE